MVQPSARITEMTNAIPGVRAIAIDLDGTLLDTVPDLCSAVNRALTELGLSELPLQLVKSFVGKGLGEHMRKSLLAVLKRELELAYAVSELADATEFVTRVQAHSDGLPV